jgi:hypothetical protein
MPGSEFMGTLVLVPLGNRVVVNVALHCWKSEAQLFRKRPKMTTPSNCRPEPNVLFGPAT